MAFADVLNEEARDLAALGVDVIQFDEPAFNVYLDEVVGWGIEALHRAAADLPCRTAVHICYGYGIPANIEWKRGLGREWRQYERIFPALAASHIDQVSLECANSHVPIELLALLAGKDVLVGAIDVASDEAETPEAGRGDDRTGAAPCPAGAAVSVHELRHGAARPHAGEPEASGACRRRRAGARPLSCGFRAVPLQRLLNRLLRFNPIGFECAAERLESCGNSSVRVTYKRHRRGCGERCARAMPVPTRWCGT